MARITVFMWDDGKEEWGETISVEAQSFEAAIEEAKKLATATYDNYDARIPF